MQAEEDRDALLVKAKEGDVDAIINWLSSLRRGRHRARVDASLVASSSPVHLMQALQVGHQIAAQQVAQTQKLRGLVSQQITMMATWHSSEQAAKDLAQTRREDFFNSNAPSTSGGQVMEPRW